MSDYSVGDGRIWMQTKKFQSFDLLLPYGMQSVTDPVGSLAPVREPSAANRRMSVITDILRAEPGLPEFQINTRLRKTLNYMFGLGRRAVDMQLHLGECGRADNYFGSEAMLYWEVAMRGDMSLDNIAKIEGDDSPIVITVPWSAMVGPILVDFTTEFLSQRTIVETEAILDMAFLESEFFEDCKSQEDAGENGYAVTEALSGSPVNVANVWYTSDKGESWGECSSRPFAGGEDISSIVVLGTKNNHRVIVSRGTTDGANPAEIAYCDVSVLGTVTWVAVNVGSVDGQYITKLYWPEFRHLFAITDDGYVYRSMDGGASFVAVLTTAVESLNGISGIAYGENAGYVWVVGDNNVMYFSDDNGDTWTAITGPTAGSGDNNTAVCVVPNGIVFVGNDAGELYGSYDGGVSWHTLSVQGVTPTFIDAIKSWGNTIIWLAITDADGGKVLRSTDGGANFRLWSLNMPTNAGLNSLEVVDPNIVYVGGEPQGGTAFISKTRSNIVGIGV